VYAYWKVGRQNDHAVFDLYFRKNPFKGEYTVFAGLEEALALINAFRFTDSDIAYLRTVLTDAEDAFFEWLATVDCSAVKVYAIKEGTIVFPRVPLVRIEGSLAVGQLLETPLLNLLNYASLITTNATRFKRAAGPGKSLLEFGLRRAQGPDGGLSASRYSYMAGFDGTSNVLAGKLHGIPIKGTHAHAFVQAHMSLDDVKIATLDGHNLYDITMKYRRELDAMRTNDVRGCIHLNKALGCGKLTTSGCSNRANWRHFCPTRLRSPTHSSRSSTLMTRSRYVFSPVLPVGLSSHISNVPFLHDSRVCPTFSRSRSPSTRLATSPWAFGSTVATSRTSRSRRAPCLSRPRTATTFHPSRS
jgi:hypothetical protein